MLKYVVLLYEALNRDLIFGLLETLQWKIKVTRHKVKKTHKTGRSKMLWQQVVKVHNHQVVAKSPLKRRKPLDLILVSS